MTANNTPDAGAQPVAVGNDGREWPHTFDGHAWAVEFNKRFPSVSVDDALGWFCNAIMRGYDSYAQKHRVAASDEPGAVAPILWGAIDKTRKPLRKVWTSRYLAHGWKEKHDPFVTIIPLFAAAPRADATRDAAPVAPCERCRNMTNALGFFASVIKSGEKWSVECDKMLRAAFDTTPHPDAAARDAARVTITDAMVDAAAREWHYHYSIPSISRWDRMPEYQRDKHRDYARTALTAALRASDEPTTGGDV